MKLLVATRSEGKAREIREIFRGLPFTLVFPADLGLDPRPEEDELEAGATFQENAILKARYFAQRAGLPTVAEDSGIQVDALDGEPGVRSARWAGVRGPGTDQANNRLLLERLRGVPSARRTARYRCVVAFVKGPLAGPHCVEAVSDGRILEQPRGSGGFGYDSLFLSVDLDATFAEAPPPAKHRVSHRGRAFRALIELLLRLREEGEGGGSPRAR